MSAKNKTATPTEDGHYVIIDGRKWRATNPNLPPDIREALVADLMKARRDVGAALKAHDKAAEENARARVQAAKEGLGERGPKWWDEPKGENENDAQTD